MGFININFMLTHINSENQPEMIDVSAKAITQRKARAQSIVVLNEAIFQHLKEGEINSKKGPVFQTAILAGTMAVKETSKLIPLCHQIPIENCKFTIQADEKNFRVNIKCSVTATHKTGVEMEALTGASLAALTVYDMCKALSHDIRIESTCLLEKTGGKEDFQSLK